jgi:hypothetical protein
MARKINGQQLGAYEGTIRIDGKDYSFAQALQLAFDDLAEQEETSSSGIIIPQIDFHTSAFSDGLEVFAFWRPQNFDFLQYNPEVWLYRYKRSRKKPLGTDYMIKRKKFVHPVHLWGEKYEASNLYSGRPDITNKLLNEEDPKENPLLDPPRRESEWDCPTAPFEKLFLATDWDKWFRGSKPAGQGTPHEYNAAEKEIFRFGIVIDNTNEETNTRYPKLHGPLSNSELVITKNVGGLRWFVNDVPHSRRGVGSV